MAKITVIIVNFQAMQQQLNQMQHMFQHMTQAIAQTTPPALPMQGIFYSVSHFTFCYGCITGIQCIRYNDAPKYHYSECAVSKIAVTKLTLSLL